MEAAEAHPSPQTPRSTISLDEVLQNLGVGRFHWRLWLISGLGFAAAAIEVVLAAFLLPVLRKEWNLSEYRLALLPTVVGIGSLTGGVLWGTLADCHGRTAVFTATAALVAVGGCLSAAATDMAVFMATRVLVSFAYGGNIAVDFPLFSEFIPTPQRGQMLFLMQAFWPVGELAACFLAWGAIPRWGWRTFLVLCAVPSIISCMLRPSIPESPRWLLVRGYRKEAAEVVRMIAAENGKTPEEIGLSAGVGLTLENEATSLSLARRGGGCGSGAEGGRRVGVGGSGSGPGRGSGKEKSVTGLSRGGVAAQLLSPKLASTTLGCLLFAASLHSCSYGIFTFMPTMLAAKGVKGEDMYRAMAMTAGGGLPGIAAAWTASSALGRLPPLKATLLVAGCCILFMNHLTWKPALDICLFLGSCCTECGYSLFQTYVPEAYPTELRSTAIGVVSAFGTLIGLGVPVVAATMFEVVGPFAALWFFAAMTLPGSLGAIALLRVETAHRDLDDRVDDGPMPAAA